MLYLIPVLIGYLLGCSNLAYFIGRLKNKDLRGGGSGNLGASNATILLGWSAGVAVAVHDIGKAFLAAFLAKHLFPELEYAPVAAGVACVWGHIFPFYLSFKGGKGFASYFGLTLALNWKLALVIAGIVILVTLLTDYIVVGTFSTITLVPAYMGFTTQNWMLVGILLTGTLVIFFKHRENIVRLARRQEIGLRSTMRGDHRKQKGGGS